MRLLQFLLFFLPQNESQILIKLELFGFLEVFEWYIHQSASKNKIATSLIKMVHYLGKLSAHKRPFLKISRYGTKFGDAHLFCLTLHEIGFFFYFGLIRGSFILLTNVDIMLIIVVLK